MSEIKNGCSSFFTGNFGLMARDGVAERQDLTAKRSKESGEIHVYLQSDAARRAAAQFQLTPEVRRLLIDLQMGRVPGISLGAKNNTDVVKFLQAVAGLPQTGRMDRALEAFVRRVQSEARINCESGEVVSKWTERNEDDAKLDETKFAKFKVDGNVRLSIRAFIFKAKELGVLADEEFKDLLQPFSDAMRARLNIFVEDVSQSLDPHAASMKRFVKTRWDEICKNDGIEIDIQEITQFVNKQWKDFGLSAPIDELGACRILAALQTICKVESDGSGYSAANRRSSARGRYQFMWETVRECRRSGVIGEGERFPACATADDRKKQDCVAIWLMGSKEKNRRVLDDIVRGDVHSALSQMSYEWAGLPAKNGLSRYHKRAGNKARISYREAVNMMTVEG